MNDAVSPEAKPDSAGKKISYAVITPSGRYPEEGEEKINADKQVADALKKAANKLKLKDTTDWVVFVGDDEIDSNLSFEAQGLVGTILIEWHKREGGGGASARC